MCFENDAKQFSGLKDIESITINPRSSTIVAISENFFAGWITTSVLYENQNKKYRLVSCAHGLSKDSSSFAYYVETNLREVK